MFLNMIHQVPISQRYGYPFTYNVRMAIKHLSPHLRIIVVSGLRVIYTIIPIYIKALLWIHLRISFFMLM